jgi:pimeloyl-ACP methyl ester carboxylesterase
MKTLVMISAFGCTGELYAPQVKALKSIVRTQIIIPTQDRYAAMVQEVLQQAPDTFAILGTSMGGRVALEVALAAPDRVDALCVIGAGAGAVADRAAGFNRSARIRAGEKAAVITEMANIISHMPGPRGLSTKQAFIDMGLAFDDHTLARQSDAIAHRIDLWDEISTIECPTLCLWGEHDQFSPAKDGLRIAESVGYGSYVELPDCGHFPTLEYPHEATEAITMWLDDIDDVGEDLE